MSQLSIYETNWINLVFENRNQAYGAYQLRQENTKTSFQALLLGMLLLVSAVSVPMILNLFKAPSLPPDSIPGIVIRPIHLNLIIDPLVKPKAVLPRVKNPIEVPVKTSQMAHPVIVQANLASPDVPLNSVANTTAPVTDGGTTGTASATTGAVINTSTLPTDTNAIVTTVALDKLPEFPGGINKFYMYVGNNFEKPEIESSKAIRVYVSFVIEKDGSMTAIQVLKDPGYGLGNEAVRVLKSLKTKWTPGILAGKAVRTAYNLPIIIQME
ncbi:energy transducer TonB [Flavobacterium restrictum]|uniref:Ferric siderophore ABC transporter substrate-binding protein n=1 Tax=Flavobacterium restrictum TaxID=2594428 RepID=A0A553E2T9_9FLAO|nr:energy transducer TonB [Flavobacterium restrictum]TRX39192.1 ferric siderophore ABC transporter substrate-binding protein [Flavobacterium restrictum]